ncbi:MAG: outer membrane lipid asymmetry maintenance protein MlaD [Thermodesulfovibrio sp.]|uniref:outer membrane lipid asymmetry maintenance protein MlaD n=1 Tax=unclassified Thermodesulfovibrio TaxID=2645936 RepID=UPI000839F611|nr:MULTISPECIES: outer membrane lipid asymmetry maintenance protein MlaD [unclassified Thermodesulfovibrio]MDI1471399.1 outer membrane lipid asymmetry maintenance protein MlaD [Thermodesulfovibrio sp. 1176]MDI6714574.1 outer membrane lipid asymmetry maintenance protein MlaD [Thermodesulfovibrio sp.]ODA43824.1 putative ABC transporter, periplasmic component YrbD [Thermodesulfovibrio sp. N1]
MKRENLEIAVGIFVLIGIIALGYLSFKLGKIEFLSGGYYTLYAEFDKVGGIKKGSVVEIAGVPVGSVEKVTINERYHAVVEIRILNSIKLPEDSIASVRTKGLIGEKYIQITPGGSEQYLAQGGKIRETESSIDIEEVLSKYVFGKI